MRTLAIGTLAAAVLATGVAAQDTRTEAKLTGSALINQWIRAGWENAGIKPVAGAGDAEFLRRVYLDVVGEIPSLEESERFLADKSPNKRAALVDALLRDERYADHWAELWSGILVGFANERSYELAREKETRDLQALFRKNTPYDEFARTVITVDGPVIVRAVLRKGEKMPGDLPKEVPLASYIVRMQSGAGKDFPLAMAGKLSRVFMGVQIQCAQCHDHPFDKWTQEDFYGMASFFSGVHAWLHVYVPPGSTDGKSNEMMDIRYKVVGDRDDKKDAELEKPRGKNPAMRGDGADDLTIPDAKTGPIKAAFLETHKGIEPGVGRRDTFAKHMTEPSNLQFARMCVNRYWAHFFGAGIVNPVDDFNGKNKPSHPELLSDLAKDFIAHKYDLHWLITAITSSEAYTLTSRAPGKVRDPQAEKNFALARVRALSPEVILRSTLEAVGQGGSRTGAGAGEPGSARDRAVAAMLKQFRYSFDDDEGGEVAEFTGTIPSALLVMNSPIVGDGTTAQPGTGLGKLLAKYRGDGERIRAIFLTALSRPPSGAESSRWASQIKNREKGYEDLFWTLLNTSEFLFNH